MEPKRPFDPLRPIEPLPSPFRPPSQRSGLRDDELLRMLKEILDRIGLIEDRLRKIEEALHK